MVTLLNPVLTTFDDWPPDVAECAHEVRKLWRDTAAEMDIARLDESLKWGEPAWRPRKGGTTLRMSWKAEQNALGIFVDCKTDLCARMQGDYPDAFRYVPPRVMYLALSGPFPEMALTHLARIAFCYKRVIPNG